MDLHYLDEDIIATCSNLPSASQGTFSYIVRRVDTNGNIGTVFMGNTFKKSGQTSKDFDITDLINNERYICKDLFDTSTNVNLMCEYFVVLTINNTAYTSNYITVCNTYRSPRKDPRLDCKYIEYNAWPLPAD